MNPLSTRQIIFCLSVSGAFLLLLLLYGPVNVEQYHHSWQASRVLLDGLVNGEVVLWTDAFGLGTPLPLGENLAFHPLFLLQKWLSLRVLFSIFWLLHLSLAAVYVLRLAQVFGMSTLVGRAVTVCYVFSGTTANLSYTDDWPSAFLGWTMFPIIVYYTFQLSRRRSMRRASADGALLALLIAFVVLNSHVGYLVVLFASLALLVLTISGGDRRLLAVFALITAVAAVIVSERLFFIATEGMRFADDFQKVTEPPLALWEWTQNLYRPLRWAWLSALLGGDVAGAWQSYLADRLGQRQPYMGVVFFGAAVTGTFLVVRRTVEMSGRWVRGLAVVFPVTLICSLMPAETLLGLASAMWEFREPAFFFGLLLAGVTLTRLELSSENGAIWAKRLVSFQYAQTLLAILPALLLVYVDRGANVEFYEGSQEPQFVEWLSSQTGGDGARLFLSPDLSVELMNETTVYAPVGLLGTGDLTKAGVVAVNGMFKAVSMDELDRSKRWGVGQVRSRRRLIGAPGLLDVLGVEFVLLRQSELALFRGAPSGEFELASRFGLRSGDAFLLMRNRTAWGRATFMAPEAAGIELPPRPRCVTPGFLCMDMLPLVEMRESTPVETFWRHGQVSMVFDSTEAERFLMLSTVFRSEWAATADDGRRLAVVPIAGTLLGVEVPRGVSSVDVVFRPRARRLLLLVGMLAAAVCAVILIKERVRRGKRSGAT